MIAIKNGDVLGALLALRKLDDVKLEATVTLKVVKLNKVLSTHWEDVESVRKTLVLAAAKRDENGDPVAPKEDGSVEIEPTKQADLEKEFQALLDQPFEVDEKYVLSAEKDFTGIKVEPAVFQGLGDLIA